MIQVLLKLLKKVSLIARARETLIYASVYMLAIWVIATILFSKFENVSLFEAFYWVVTTTTTVGYGDIVAKTFAGRTLAIIVMLSGIGVLGVFLASIADMLIEKSLKRKVNVKSYMKNHILVCGWNEMLKIACRELLEQNKQIIVIAPQEELELIHENLLHIKGHPSDDETLKRAGIEKASFALIACENDTETLLAAIAIEKLNPKIVSTCIVSDPKVMQALRKIGVDQILSTQEFFGLALSRSIFVPKLSNLLNEIMSAEGMEFYQTKLPKKFVNKSFAELMLEFKEKYNAIPLAVVRDSKLIVNPSRNIRLNAEDAIIYIAEHEIKF